MERVYFDLLRLFSNCMDKDNALLIASSTASIPSQRAAARIIATICRSPWGAAFNLRRTRSIADGRTQPWNGAPLRNAPGLRASTGT